MIYDLLVYNRKLPIPPPPMVKFPLKILSPKKPCLV